MAKTSRKGFSPFLKQCYVVSGVAINIVGHGTVIGFTAVLFPRLREPGSEIQIDATSASWIASIVGFTLLLGNAITPYAMERWGRRTAHLLTTVPLALGWFIVITGHSVTALIIGRLFQGVAMGMLGPLSSILIGEYTSPKNRGMFLTGVSLSLAIGTLVVHSIGSFLSWQCTALVCTAFPFVSFVIVTFSPETPSWLASKGFYDDCREAFHWLRGTDNEEETNELEAMIDARQYEIKTKELELEMPIQGGFIKRYLRNISTTMRKKEFSKPIIVMMHLYTMFQFAGLNVLSSYMVDILHAVIGENADAYFWMIMLGCLRLVANMFAVFLMRNLKRRTLLYSAGVLCVSSLLGISAYVFSKTHGYLPYEVPWIPILLINAYMFSLATGMAPIPFTIAGEIFPVAYRSLGSGISVIFLSSMNFASVKSAPSMFASVGIHGTFCVYAGIVTYCLVVVWFFLPETKDRTLQEIEEEFRGTPFSAQDFKSMQSLQSVKSLAYHNSRRCSNPVMY